MDNNGWRDIGYNFLVRHDGTVYEGAQGTWMAVGAHVYGHNSENIGVCVIGTNADITNSAKSSVRWLYDEACRRSGKTLAKRYHSMYANNPKPGANNTECPGDNLRNWVRAGMPLSAPPTINQDDFSLEEDMPNGDLINGFAFDVKDNWVDTSKAVPVPLPAVGTGPGQWGPAWLFLAGSGDDGSLVRFGSFIGVGYTWTDVNVVLTEGSDLISLPPGTTKLLIGRKPRSETDIVDDNPVRWHVQYGQNA